MPTPLLCQGVTPLTARTEPWMTALLTDPNQCATLLDTYGSPLNIHNFDPLTRNITELTSTASHHGIRFAVYVARKANKTLNLVTAAHTQGAGIDVASTRELRQTLAAGVPGPRIVFSAAIKTRDAITDALRNNVTISLDNLDEAHLVTTTAHTLGLTAHIAFRLAITDPHIAPTRFGLPATDWLTWLTTTNHTHISVDGLHFHLNGYSATERATALRHAITTIDDLRARGCPASFIDMGGGVPMSYLDNGEQWHQFWAAVDRQPAGSCEVTWRGDRLGLVDAGADRPSPSVYPYYQDVVRGEWLENIVTSPVAAPTVHDGHGSDRPTPDTTIADALASRDIELRCEPGRSMLDGCGMTLARVMFRKHTSDGVPLVGLAMNRTQVRSTSADFLVDPVLVRPTDAGEPNEPGSGFFVGAYCIEEELLARRRFVFPQGVAVGDIVAFPNTGGYLMHIVESASHQIPLAANIVATGDRWELDPGETSDARAGSTN